MLERKTTRRAVIAGAAVAAATPATASRDTPVAEAFARWRAAYAKLGSFYDDDGSFQEVQALSDRVMEAPAKDARDILAKIIALSEYGQGALDERLTCPAFWREAADFI